MACPSPASAGSFQFYRSPGGVPDSRARRGEPFEPPRFVDDALEQSRDRAGVERAGVGRAHAGEHVRFARRLVDRQPGVLLQPADLQRARRALVQQRDELACRADRCPRAAIRSSARSTLSASARTVRRRGPDRRRWPPRVAMTSTIALPTTAASAYSAHFGDVLRPRDAEPERDRQRRHRAHAARPAARRCRRRSSRAPVTPSREIAYRNPRPRRAGFLQPRVVVVGLTRKI